MAERLSAELNGRTQNGVRGRHNWRLRAQLKLGKGKRISRRAFKFPHGSKRDRVQNNAYTGGRGAWTKWTFYPRKADMFKYDPLPGYTINY